MANAEQLAILKQGVKTWNKWREENPKALIDLLEADLSGANLIQANLSYVHLIEADLSHAHLAGANFDRSNLSRVNLTSADLSGAHLITVDLNGASLRGANLNRTNLIDVDLSATDLHQTHLCRADLRVVYLTSASLSGADLSESSLRQVHFTRTDLTNVNLAQTEMMSTVFAAMDLSVARSLEKIIHKGPSTIGTDTLVLSKGKIPDAFLRGCGLSDWEIEMAKLYNPDLSNEERNGIHYKVYDLQAGQALQISPLFISYSHGDSAFVDKVGDCLTKKGIRYWRDIHDMKAGRMEKQIDRAIRQNPTVLLVLSEHSLSSDWVEHEARTARQLEKDTDRDVLCPVALDDSWKSSRWPKRIMEQIMEYNILDFSEWQDDSKFDGMFRKLIDGLELFYKG